LRIVLPEDQTTILRLLTERHDDLVRERIRMLNRLHAVLRDLPPGGVSAGLSTDKAAAAMKSIRPATATDACRRDMARDLLAALRRLDRQVKDNESEMRDALAATRTALTTPPGLGAVLAAKVIGHVGDVSRFPTEHHFAGYTGSAPLDASSGNNVRHRLNTGGNRALNSVLHVIAACHGLPDHEARPTDPTHAGRLTRRGAIKPLHGDASVGGPAHQGQTTRKGSEKRASPASPVTLAPPGCRLPSLWH
jgi:transposase